MNTFVDSGWSHEHARARLPAPFAVTDQELTIQGEPALQFCDSPPLLLEAVRIATQQHLNLSSELWEAATEAAPKLASVPRVRVRDEYSAILTTHRPSRGLVMLRDSGLLAASVPQLLVLTRMPDHGPRHPLSLWDHTMRALDAVPPDPAVRWAALLHDIGKPSTRTHEPDGRPRFFHHEDVGGEMSEQILTGLEYREDIVARVVLLVSTHMQLHAFSAEWSDNAVRRLCQRFGPCIEQALQLARADAGAHTLTGRGQNAPRFDLLEARLRALNAEPPASPKSPLSGEDLMARYQRPPGPWIRTVKEALEQAVREGHLSPENRHAAWEIADRTMSEAPLG